MTTICGKCGGESCACPPPPPRDPPPPPPEPGARVAQGLDVIAAYLGAMHEGVQLQGDPVEAERRARDALGGERAPVGAVKVAGVAHRAGRAFGLILALGRAMEAAGGGEGAGT